jgi:HlyD family secretion protein
MALNEQRLRSSTSAKQVERSVVRAPNSGVVDKLAITAVGDVVSPAQPMLEIVPDKDRLMVEVAISPADIDRIRLGMTARVQVAAGSGNAKPEMKGKVEYVSASRSTDASKQTSFFIVRVSIDPQTVPSSARSALRPGSPADVFIETGSRSMLSYLTRPLRDQFARAFARD